MKPINLNRARKTKAKRDAKTKADENAVKFGRTKAQRELEAMATKQAAVRHSDHKREPN